MLVLLAFPLLADAQTGGAEGMIVGPGGLCMDVDAVARGASVILTRCSGLSRQRWRMTIGDYQRLQHVPSELCPSPDAHNEKLVLGDRCDGWWLNRTPTELRFDTQCVTAGPGARPPLALRPCDGSAAQRFNLR